MPDKTSEETLDHMKDIVEQEINHLVRHQENTEGIIKITAKTDNTYDIELHNGSENRSKTIEGVSKSRLLKMMEKQL